ncbi:MAG TPA: hypothetical protein VF222_05295 [Nitrososphaeraceae archaeon]
MLLKNSQNSIVRETNIILKYEKRKMKYMVKNFQLMIMINSKNSLYAISSGILMMMILLSPLHTIKAQEENEESDPLTILSNIRNLLDKSITELNTGNYTGASELVDIAYIDNYEYIEDPLKELDNDLMEETEIMIREDFASAIEDKKSLDEITTLHNAIKSNLDIAEKLFKK